MENHFTFLIPATDVCVLGTLFGNFLNLTSLFLVAYQHLKVLGCMPNMKHALDKDVLLKWSCPVCSKVLKNNFVISNSKFPSFNFASMPCLTKVNCSFGFPDISIKFDLMHAKSY